MQFKRGYSQRPSFLFSLRTNAAQIFTGLNPRYFNATKIEARKEPDCVRYLKWDIDAETYPSDPPHIYPNFERVLSKKYRSPWLINVGTEPTSSSIIVLTLLV